MTRRISVMALVAFVTVTATSKTLSRSTSVGIITSIITLNITYCDLLRFTTAGFEVLCIVVCCLHTLSDFQSFGQCQNWLLLGGVSECFRFEACRPDDLVSPVRNGPKICRLQPNVVVRLCTVPQIHQSPDFFDGTDNIPQ